MPKPEHDRVLEQLAQAVKRELTATVRVATNAARKSGIVTPQEIKETVDRAASEWLPE